MINYTRINVPNKVFKHNRSKEFKVICRQIADSNSGKQLKDIIRFLLTNCSKSHLRTMLSHDTQNTDVPTYIEVNSL